MGNPSVIALIGQAGSGKTEVARHLIINHSYQEMKFAGILKDMLRSLGLSEEEINGSLKEAPSSLLLGTTPRHAMQTLGTEWGRDLIHPDIWAHAWKVQVTEYLSYGHKVVCDDCRFENEVKVVHDFHGAQIWRILRKDLPPRMEHSSENVDVLPFDRTIKNYGSIGELKTAVDGILSS